MILQKDKDFVEKAFCRLQERGWFQGQEFEPSTITEEEIAAFEQRHQVVLPSLYKAFLTYRRLPRSGQNTICAVLEDLEPLWLMLNSPRSMDEVSEYMENLQIIRDFCELPEDCFHNLIPIGDWGAGWGPLCIDLSMSEEEVDEDDEDTWSLVWFDHEEFDWEECYLGDDDHLYGQPAAPNFRMLLEWYFFGSMEPKYEQQEGQKPTYEWYQNYK